MDLIAGLPLHPLIIHAVAVLLPLAAIGTLLVIAIPKLRGVYSPLVLMTLSVATASAFIAEQSGVALSERVGLPVEHALQGERLWKVAFLLTIGFVLSFAIDRSKINIKSRKKLAQNSLNAVISILAILSLILTFIVGHSGATASWEDRIATTEPTQLEEPTSGSTAAPAATLSGGAVALTIAEVKLRNSKVECWSVVNGNVYNLTSYVQSHPGGAAVITKICGKDGTKAFSTQHNSASKPKNVLSGFLLGPLGGQISLAKSKEVITPPASANTGGEEEGEEGENDGD